MILPIKKSSMSYQGVLSYAAALSSYTSYVAVIRKDIELGMVFHLSYIDSHGKKLNEKYQNIFELGGGLFNVINFYDEGDEIKILKTTCVINCSEVTIIGDNGIVVQTKNRTVGLFDNNGDVIYCSEIVIDPFGKIIQAS